MAAVDSTADASVETGAGNEAVVLVVLMVGEAVVET